MLLPQTPSESLPSATGTDDVRGNEAAWPILFSGMLRGVCALVVVVLLLGVAPARAADELVVLEGVGAAHGFGMAMDGVEGQARAGWSHTRILDLFYPGTAEGRAGGPVRVGLGTAAVHTLTLPGGGVVSDVPSGAGALHVEVAPGSSVSVGQEAGRLVVGAVASEEGTPTPAAPPLGPTPPVELPATPPPATPAPTEVHPPPSPPPAPPSTDGSVWILPSGDPAVTLVGVTGRRYRGPIELRRDAAGQLVAVNHVDLETYVAGIAEEKGQDWPIEGLKALAVAARSLAVASRTWYSRNHGSGYDICPTGNCQVYLGYDGEEPAMRRAAAETAGRIRTYKGTAILAMYHGNGGGQTESYARMAGKPEDVHPYLRSVRYPFAEPRQWRFEKPMAEIAETLRTDEAAAARGIPSRLERIEIVERGESPRVARVRLIGAGGTTELSGSSFARALGLPSTWFSFPQRSEATVSVAGRRVEASGAATIASVPSSTRPGPWGPLASFAIVAFVVAVVAVLLDARMAGRSAVPSILARGHTHLARSARRRDDMVVARLLRRRR